MTGTFKASDGVIERLEAGDQASRDKLRPNFSFVSLGMSAVSEVERGVFRWRQSRN